MGFNELGTPAKVGVIIGICCIGLFIIGLIAGLSSPDKNTNTNKNNNDNGVTLTIDGKSFKVHNLTSDEIKNIQGNNTSTIDFCNGEDGRYLYKISKASKNTTILNELLPEDNITKITRDGITYQNIIFSDGTPSMTVFKTKDGSIYEITYYNGNDFLFDYQDFGKQMNT